MIIAPERGTELEDQVRTRIGLRQSSAPSISCTFHRDGALRYDGMVAYAQASSGDFARGIALNANGNQLATSRTQSIESTGLNW